MVNQNNSSKVVFVHSSFRTGSTFVRSCFRKNPNAFTFQEVFNENLATMGNSDIANFNPENWNSKHPLIAPYFLEFHALLSENGGVNLYDRAMSYDYFFSDEISEAEAAYIDQLIKHAESHGKVPVITCTRSLGRMKALKDRFGGLHLVLYRNIFHQWCSYTDQWIKGNPGFIETVWLALNGAHGNRIARSIGQIYSTSSRSALDPKNFLAFALLHLYLYARAIDEASAVIDIDKIASIEAERDAVETLIFDHSGLKIDFGSAKQSRSFSLVDIGGTRVLNDTLCAFPEIFNYPETERGKKFLDDAKASLIEEFDRFSKTSGSLAKAFADQLSQLEDARNNLAQSQEEVHSLRAHAAMLDNKIKDQDAQHPGVPGGAKARRLRSFLKAPFFRGR